MDLSYISYVGKEKETDGKMNFMFFHTFNRFTTLVNDSRHAWSLFGANIG